MSKKDKEMIGGCCVCSDERGWSENPLVYCDGAGCNVAVHQACYGIVHVPTGPWFCRKCESQERVARVKCELCPQRAGALKRTDSGGWCHVVCALYIPEACFANVQTMEPIVLNAVPQERFSKICYICEEQKRDTKATAGACMQCNKTSCKQYFHVTCAQTQGLLCEVTGSYDNVTYCGYCSHHYKKLKNHSNVKTIPAFRHISNENGTSDSSPEKTNSPKPNLLSKLSNKAAVLKKDDVDKSSQVDQAVSSTSDSVTPVLNTGGGDDKTSSNGDKKNTISTCSSQVHDISSAVSPTREDTLKQVDSTRANNSDHSSLEEPSPMGKATSSQGETVTKAKKQPDKAPSPSTTEQLEVDVTSVDARSSPSAPTSTVPKRRHSNAQDKHKKPVSKKQKPKGLAPLKIESRDGAKKSTKKRCDSGGSNQAPSTNNPLQSPSGSMSSLPGHHDYCGNTFGGSPYFQSLSAPGYVSLPNFSMRDVGSSLSGTTNLIQPPKYFPSLNNPASFNHDRSKDMPLSMEQLLEQQWEQGANFLMQQGQHFDISSLLNCLHKVKSENQVLEDQVRELTSRRNHLRMVNARLALPLTTLDNSTSETSVTDGSSRGDGPAHPVSKARNPVTMGSLEDISSPESQTPLLSPEPMPSHSGSLMPEIFSPGQEKSSSQPHFEHDVNESTSLSSLSNINQTLKCSTPHLTPPPLSAMVSPPPTLTKDLSSSSAPLSTAKLSSPPPPLLLDQSQVPSLTSSHPML